MRLDHLTVARAAVFAAAVCGAGLGRAETVDAAAYGFDPAAKPEANAAALQAAVAGGRRTVTVSKPGKYYLGSQVLLDSDTVLDCAKGVVFEKARRFPCLLVNRGAFTGVCNSNIVVRGLEIHAAPNRFNVRADEASGCLGLRTCLGFVHARDIAVERFRFFDRTEDEYCLAYVIQFSDFANVRVEDFEIRAKKDGIHLNKGRGFVIRNGVTTTWDDAVAINAGEWPVAVSEQMGSIEDGLVENVRDEPWADGPWKFEKLRANFSRVITGCWQEWRKGMEVVRGDIFKIGANVYSVVFPSGFTETRVSNIPPAHERGVWTSPEGIPYLCIQHDGATRADVRNVTFRNITLAYDRSVFCNWEIGAGKARLVHPDIPPQDYPETAITLENVVGEQDTPLVTGTASFALTMRRCRARNLLVDVKEHPNRPTHRRIVLEDCPFAAKDAGKVDFRIDGASAEIVVKGAPERQPKAVGTAKASVVADRTRRSASLPVSN